MPTHLRRRLRHARRFVGYGVMVVVVLVAVLVGIANQLLPLAERHPDKIAAWLSERAGRPVQFTHVETEWTRRGPLLRLDDLRIGDARQSIVIGDTEMLVSLYAGLWPGRTFTELRLRGLDLTVQRADDGQWSVRGLPGQEVEDPLAALERLGEVQIIGGRLRVVAPAMGIDAIIPRIDLRLRVQGDRVRTGLRAWMQTDRACRACTLDAMLDFDHKRGDGRAYAGATNADLAVWSPLLRVMGAQVRTGHGRAQAWAELRDHRIAAVVFDAMLEDVALHGAPLRDASGVRSPEARFDHVEMRARLRHVAGQWRFDAPRLRIASNGNRQVLDRLLLFGGTRYGLRAERVDAAPLLAVAALSDRMDAGLRRWLLLAKPTAVLERVEVAGVRGGVLRANGTVSGVGFAPVGDAPGVRHLAGSVVGDADGFVFEANPRVRVDFDWPSGFGVVHPMTLRGAIAGWREGAGWRVGTDALRVRGDDFGLSARGGLWWQGDGTLPWIDIAADLDESPVPAAKGFLVRHLMADTTEHWLDTALLAGKVQRGRAVVSGDLDDWPFRDRNGLFRADAHLQDATVKFSPDWPAAAHMTGEVSFVANGFSVEGHAMLAGVPVPHLRAGIEDFSRAELTVQADSESDAAQLLALLRESPLRTDHGETFANIAANGPATVTFDMLLPMHQQHPSAKRTQGTVELRGARLRENRWNLAFDDVRGRAEYGEGGFAANALTVRHDGQPGTLALRAGKGFVRDAAQAFEGELTANIAMKDLIDRAGNLAWLRPYLDGRSNWTIAVALSANATRANAAPSKLTLRSNLVGTTLDLPAPVRKAASVPLAATIETDLPMGEGEVRVGLGNLVAVRARTRGNDTGLRIVLGAPRVDEAPPPSGLVATGHAGALDLIDWIGLAARGGDTNGSQRGGLALRRIDLRADRLGVLGGVFPDAHVVVSPVDAGNEVTVTGPALAGTVMIPDAKGAAISGRFDRVHWRAPPTSVAASATPTTPDPRPLDPATIPPLRFDIDDFRLNALSLGQATVRTRPTASGLHFDQLQTQSRTHRLALGGDWNGTGTAARTHLDLQIQSSDFGALLKDLGFGGQLSGGTGTARFDAIWAGSPEDFRIVNVVGTLALDVKSGTLLEIEPGAGRVLGLLSLAQLPRRMLLDFRDFFSKGLAFDRVDGHVQLAQGNAHTDDLRIDGPAAQIGIRGNADLQAQTFDQTVEVVPRAGNLLTVAGAIAGGPVGAALGAAANAVLKKPLGQLTARTYRVTGPWKDPEVDVHKPAPAPAPDG